MPTIIKIFTLIIFTLISVNNVNADNIFDYEDDFYEETYNEQDSEKINDPLEPINRKIFTFNHYFDKYALGPTARLYKNYIPAPIQRGIKNFNTNLQKPISTISSLILLEPKNAFYNLRSFTIDTTFGLFGIINLSKHFDDNETDKNIITVFNHYEIGQGIYLVIPFIGPQTTRNITGIAIDTLLNPIYLYDFNKDHELAIELFSKSTTILELRARNDENINFLYENSF